MPVNLHSQCMYFGRHTCNLEIIVHVLQESLAQASCSTSLVAGRNLESAAVQIWARAQQARRLVLGNEGAQGRCTPGGPADLSMRRAPCLDLCPWLGICLFLHMVLMTAGCWLCTGPAAWAASVGVLGVAPGCAEPGEDTVGAGGTGDAWCQPVGVPLWQGHAVHLCGCVPS